MSKIEKPKHQKENRQAFTATEQAKFLEYARADSKCKYYFYYLFYFYTGCRTSEIYAIQKKDINFEKKTVFINGTKTKTSCRTIPLFAPLKELESIVANLADDDFVFTSGEYNVRKEFNKLLTAIGMNKDAYSVYCLRHSFCTRLNEMRIDPKTISKWMGHSNLATTMNVYTKVLPDHEQKQADIFDAKYVA